MSSQLTTLLDATPGSNPVFFPMRKEDLIMAWPGILEFLKGRKNGFMDQWDGPSLLNELLMNNDMHLWIAHDGQIEGLMLVSFSVTPRKKILWIIGVYADNIRKYLHLHKNLEQWGAMYGAEAVMFEAAHPFARLLRKYGYATPRAMISKDIRTMWSN